jgi:hypothetical protein
MPHNQCPPSRRGHAWREVTADDLPRGEKIDLALRVCKRCGKRGRVSNQGVIHAVEAS